MTRPQSLFTFVAIAAVFAGGLAAVETDDPAAIASDAFVSGSALDPTFLEPTAAGGATASATDYAPPRGVVDPPAGHASALAASAR
jgi:hypothetical protein